MSFESHVTSNRPRRRSSCSATGSDVTSSTDQGTSTATQGQSSGHQGRLGFGLGPDLLDIEWLPGDVVICEYIDSKFYFGLVNDVNVDRKSCWVMLDDDIVYEIPWNRIHSGKSCVCTVPTGCPLHGTIWKFCEKNIPFRKKSRNFFFKWVKSRKNQGILQKHVREI